MSFSMYWEPVQPVKGNALPQELKYVLARRFFDGDGTGRGEVTLGPGAVDYIRGAADATADRVLRAGAEELIQAIYDHKIVRLWIGEQDD